MRLAPIAVAASVLLLAGCTGPTVPAPPVKSSQIGTASSIEEVRDAFIAAGGECEWEQTDQVTLASASGECSTATVISTYDNRADVEQVVATLQAIAIGDLTLLVGPNWIINSPEAESMQSELGGEWISEPAVPEQEEPEAGSLEDPLPPGYVATITDSGVDYYTVSVTLVDPDAWPAIQAENQFNEAPGDGEKYIIIAYTFTGLSDDPVDPGIERFDYSVATPDGRVFTEAIAVVPGNDLSDSPELYDGQSFTGNAAYLVPTDSSEWLVTAYGSYLQL